MKYIDNIYLPIVKKFFFNLIQDYDVSQLSEIHLTRTKTKHSTYGACYPPDITKDKKYKIRAYLKTDHDIYPLEDRHWIKVNGKVVKVKWKYDSIEEAAVYILSHELFHYLSWTAQLVDRDGKKIKNTEYNANWFAHGQVAKYSQPLQIL